MHAKISAAIASAMAAVALLSAPTPAPAGEAVGPAASYSAGPEAVFSARALAASEANRQALRALQNAPAVEEFQHRLRDGGLSSELSQKMLDSLPSIPTPNFETLRARASFSVHKGFTGIHAGDNDTVKNGEFGAPDQGLAVNNNIAAEINNNVVRFFNATTGAPLSDPIATPLFFNASGLALSDTQAFFDPTTKRWFIDELITTTKQFAVAVSKTSDPLGDYWLYKLHAASDDVRGCGGRDCLPDYPKGGYDAAVFYITANLFNRVTSTGPFVKAVIYAVPKAKLEAGAQLTFFRFDDDFDNAADFVVQPSVPAPGEPFSSAKNGSEFLLSSPGNAKIALLSIDNSNHIVSDPNSMRLRRDTVGVEDYGNGTVPSTQPNVVGPYCKSVGVTSAPKLDGGNGAFGATVQKAGGNLYAALAFAAKDGKGFNRDVVAWFVVHPKLNTFGLSASIVHSGHLVPGDGYSISYPAFGLNKTGSGVLGYTETNKKAGVPADFPSAVIIQFTGAGFNPNAFVTGQGATSDDGFRGCTKPGPGGVDRWGDYAAATVDAVTGFFYTANEMIPDPKKFTPGTKTNWGTFITQAH
jgi:hypothetical protein